MIKPETAQLSKLEFTKNIFEEVHRKQQEELALVVIGLSDQYELTKIAAHLAVPLEVWFEWREARRNEYMAKFNLMSVDDALAKKTISVTDAIVETNREFHGLSEDLRNILLSKKGYKEEVARAVVEACLCFSTVHQLFKNNLPLTRKRLKLSLKLPLILLSTEGLNAPHTPITYRVGAQVLKPIKFASTPLLLLRKVKYFDNTLHTSARTRDKKEHRKSVCE